MRSPLCCLVLLILACTAAATAQSIGFSPAFSQNHIAAGSGPGASVTVDVNHDGIPDIIVANTKGSPGISVLLGNGDATFKPAFFSTTLSDIPDQIAVGDINGDGFLDVVYASSQSANIAVMYGRGDGTFSTPIGVAHDGGTPNSISVADFNSDGKMDLLYATDSVPPAIPSKVQIAFNTGNDVNGRATFSGARRTVTQATGTVTRLFSATSGDLNADGRPDVAYLICCSNTASAPNILTQAINNADGTFTFKQPDIGTALRVVAHDFGDGRAALVLPYGPLACNGCFNNQGFSVIYNLPDGTTRKAGSAFSGTQFVTGDVTFGDFDGDGLQDVALTVSGSVPGSSGQDEVIFFQNAGTRKFAGGFISIPLGFGQFTGALGSGILHKQVRGADIVAVQATPQDVDILKNVSSFGCLPDTQGVRICTPAPNAATGTQVFFSAGTFSTSGPITALRFYVDNVNRGTFFGSTGADTLQGGETLTFTPGKHLLSVVGYTATGAFKSSLFFTVQ